MARKQIRKNAEAWMEILRCKDRIKSLENQIQILEGVVSPLRPATAERKSEQPVAINLDSLYDAVEEENEVAVKLNSTPKEATKTKKRKEKGDNNEAETIHQNESQKKKKKKKPPDQKSSNQQMENDSIIQFLDSPTHFGGTDSTSYGSTQ
ncbi:GSCOCG00009215001-RA-CDS, partial [Cotesia congregata]